jgi:hypothetical protein
MQRAGASVGHRTDNVITDVYDFPAQCGAETTTRPALRLQSSPLTNVSAIAPWRSGWGLACADNR